MKIHRNSFIEYKFLQWITEQIRLPYRFNSSSAVIKSRHVRVPIFANPHSHSRPPNLSLPNRSITSVRDKQSRLVPGRRLPVHSSKERRNKLPWPFPRPLFFVPLLFLPRSTPEHSKIPIPNSCGIFTAAWPFAK